MPGDGTYLVDILFYIIAVGVVAVLGGTAFIAAIETWRDWSDNRRIRKHLRNIRPLILGQATFGPP